MVYNMGVLDIGTLMKKIIRICFRCFVISPIVVIFQIADKLDVDLSWLWFVAFIRATALIICGIVALIKKIFKH